jgi:large subunit ribosomal protein L21
MMYAVIVTGGKQYKAMPGDLIRVEKIAAQVGETVELPILMIVNDDEPIVGKPFLDAKAQASVVNHGRGEKIKIIKFRRRKHHMKQMGHRQDYTTIKITEIGI